ncbi:hypothetical protein [Umezawaea sp.]|uniref:hypothetical protein n=1 Tax=Umezawaea sp. TaxID=1955258 RepID=UPI002ECFB7D2
MVPGSGVVRSSTGFGTGPLVLDHASTALRANAGNATAVGGSARPLTFSGRQGATVPAGSTGATRGAVNEFIRTGGLLDLDAAPRGPRTRCASAPSTTRATTRTRPTRATRRSPPRST